MDASQTLSIPRGENVELWDVKLANRTNTKRNFSLYSYAEFSFHQIPIDNQNFQMSLYCAGSDYEDGVIDYDLFYEHAHQYMAASFTPDGFDCLRDTFLGPYRTETNPLAVERGECFASFEKGNNHWRRPPKEADPGPRRIRPPRVDAGRRGPDEGRRVRSKYSDFTNVDAAFARPGRLLERKIM